MREELDAEAAAAGRSKSRLLEEAWARSRSDVAAMEPRSADLHQIRSLGAQLQAARESAALSGGNWPDGICEDVLYCREPMIEELERVSSRLAADSDALLLYCWRVR
jgi:hypothetical protein